jgi:hypothetical protein
MSIFGNLTKNKVKVIKIRTVKNNVKKSESKGYGYMYGGKTVEEIRESVEFTEILYIKNGELFVKTINGKWSLEDVKRMEG